MAGFAFGGLVLYLGGSHPSPGQIVAASLLLAAFIVLLFCAYALASLVHEASNRDEATVFLWFGHSVWSLYGGLMLLVASVCVMSFVWSRALGWVALGLSALFVIGMVVVHLHELRVPSRRG
jgi:hypothetical protein